MTLTHAQVASELGVTYEDVFASQLSLRSATRRIADGTMTPQRYAHDATGRHILADIGDTLDALEMHRTTKAGVLIDPDWRNILDAFRVRVTSMRQIRTTEVPS